jgi:hypothetical protein
MLDKIINGLIDLALVLGIIFLIYNQRDGWGWLVLILVIKLGL